MCGFQPCILIGSSPAARVFRKGSNVRAAKKRAGGIVPRAGRGTIYRHGPGFRAEVTIDGVTARDTFQTEEGAQRFLEDVVRRATRFGVSLDKSKVTVTELLELFIDAKTIQGRKKTTLQDYRNSSVYLRACFGSVPIWQLSPNHITRMMADLSKGTVIVIKDGEPEQRDPLSPKSIRNVYGAIHAALAFAVNQEIVDRNVAEKVSPPEYTPPSIKAWSQDEVAKFLAHVEGQRLEAMFWVFLSSGMRSGECAALKWADVDLESGDITVQRRLVRLGKGGGIDVSTPKTRAGSRTITLPEQALLKLRFWKDQQRIEQHVAGTNWRAEDWVFTTRSGNHLEPRWILKHLTDLIKKAKLSSLNVHGLRHTFCTMLLSGGVSVKDVAEIVGHSKPTVTANVYWQAIPGQAQKRVSAKVGDLLSPQLSPQTRGGPAPIPPLSPHEAQRSRDYSWFEGDLNSENGWARRGSNPGPHGCEASGSPSQASKGSA